VDITELEAENLDLHGQLVSFNTTPLSNSQSS